MKREKYQNIDDLKIISGQDFKSVDIMRSNQAVIYMATSKNDKMDYFYIGQTRKMMVCFVENCKDDMFKFKYNIFGVAKEKLFKRRTTAQRYALEFCKKFIKANFIRE